MLNFLFIEEDKIRLVYKDALSLDQYSMYQPKVTKTGPKFAVKLPQSYTHSNSTCNDHQK